MSKLKIHWNVNRLDEGEERDLRYAECLLEIEGHIEYDGHQAGMVDAKYLFAEDPASDTAFFELWDLDAAALAIFEEISDPDIAVLHEQIQDLLDPASGILCVHFIVLRSQFRNIGLACEVLRELVRTMADPRIGAVLLDATPLQHRPHDYGDFDDEVRNLPWNSLGQDQEPLMRHFETWGMQRLRDTRFMIASPDSLRETRTPQWPPCPVLDQWNTCIFCNLWIDLDGENYQNSKDGPMHKECD